MKLRYKIISYSSQNIQYPISNLITGQSHWQSAKFCQYPQQITIMFYEPVTINSIKIISHQIKTPEKINILHHFPVVSNQNQFKKLGYVKFKSSKQQILQQGINPQSAIPKLKQLKVIKNLQIKCQYLRMIISKNHTHASNFFNQVALSSLIIQGQSYRVETLSQITLKNNSFMQINTFVKDRIMLLNQFKQNCIKKQQYNQAKKIKQIIKQINILLQNMQELNNQKMEFIIQENYNEAARIKNQIQMIKNKIQQISNNFYDPTKKGIRTFNIQKFRKIKLNKQNQQSKQHSINQNNSNTNFQNQFIQDSQNNSLSNSKVKKQGEEQNQVQNQQNSRISHSQRVLPALLNKFKSNQTIQQKSQQAEQIQKSRIEKNLPSEPQQISPSNQANASVLVQFFQKLLIRKIHSKYWQFKNQAIQQVLKDCKQNQNSMITKNRFRAYLFVYNRILIKQNHKNLIEGVFDLLNIVTGMRVNQNEDKSQLINQLQKAVIQTLNRLQDNQNPKIKSKAEKVIIRMIQSRLFGSTIVYHAITRSYNQRLSPKIKKIYLENLEYIISKNTNNIKNQIPVTIVDFTVKKLNDASNDVRKAAINLLKSLKKAGYKDRIKICISEEDSLKQTYLKELNDD